MECAGVCVGGGSADFSTGWSWERPWWLNVSSNRLVSRADHLADLESLIPKTTKAELQGRRLSRQPLSQAESMTCNRHRWKDPVASMKSKQSFFAPKSNTGIGCWNVRSLGNLTKQNSRLRDVLHTMIEKHIEISEVRCLAMGHYCSIGIFFFTLVYLCRRLTNHRSGVAWWRGNEGLGSNRYRVQFHFRQADLNKV